MKGALKFAKRTPHLLTAKVGRANTTVDAEFVELANRFAVLEKGAERLVKDVEAWTGSVKSMLLSSSGFSSHFAALFALDTAASSHARAAQTAQNLPQFDEHLAELRETLTPEVELVESRVLAPAREYMAIAKALRKNVTKRDHKLVDYDRHSATYTKLRDKKEKSLKDEQNLFKAEQDFETAAADYEFYNNAMKEEMPRFFEMSSRFVGPLWNGFYYMQLNIFYLTLDKLQVFADGKYDISATATPGIEDAYVAALEDASERLEALSIRKPAAHSARVLATNPNRSASLSSRTSLSANAPSRTGTLGSASAAAAPPAYSTGAASPAGSGKRAPPPPPPTSKKPGAKQVEYVTALYDYAATAEGDLSFQAGDRIEVVERTASTEDWWTGKLNGVQGVFPGNYVRD